MSKTWAEIDARREAAGITKAELAREAGISESAIHTGIRTNSSLKLATAQVVERALSELEGAKDAAE